MSSQTANLPAETDSLTTDIKGGEETSQFVTFFFHEHFFGLPIEEVIEINRALETTPVPLAPKYVSGVVNLRGQILTAVHLGHRIGLESPEEGDTSYNNVITGNREEPISLLVERIGDVMSVPRNSVEPPPDLIEGVDAKFVSRVCKLPGQLLLILDGKALEASISSQGLSGQA
jgi:purine-binding chemotaxis protein CheW